ncbi:threonine/serine dehydratase [Pseudoroseomonas globiformis]|uniref:Threonine/serine dehydratase n=1 Tax=Teichococcus globiformis TaxID=2307229 RepID=A0ABV7FTJ9_9PROT
MPDDTTPWHLQPPAFAEIEAATVRIDGVLVKTPLLESERVNNRLGGRLLLKAEGLQRTGSFKARGAWNFLSQMEPEARSRGVIGFSSGNHAQAVAWAASRHGAPAVLVMPRDAPQTKIERTRGWGAEVVLYDRRTEDREAIGRDIAAARGLMLVPPFEHRWIAGGAGTVGLEMLLQAEAIGAKLDALLVNCSGGGLAAGCAIAAHAVSPETEVWAVEPAAYDDMARSLASGKRESNEGAAPSICDALLAPSPGEMTFAVARTRLRGALGVTDAEAMAAMRLAFEEFRVVVEPGGAAALAAVLAGRIEAKGRTLAVLASGANVDASLFAQALA